MHYLEIAFETPSPEALDILPALLGEIGFDSFAEEDGLLKAYIPETAFSADALEAVLASAPHLAPGGYHSRQIPHENWNAVWESNFQPIAVDDRLRVRAVFHTPDPHFAQELVIQPQMSFGTGHHATTWLILRYLLDNPPAGKKVFDFGTGTGILAILASKLGAAEVWAVDNDPYCLDNSAENLALNDTPDIHLALGDIRAFDVNDYDHIIANITRNVILEFLPEMAGRLVRSGTMVCSGFYTADLPRLQEAAQQQGFVLLATDSRDNWCMAAFKKE